MLVRLRKGLVPDQIETILALSRELGYAARFLDADRLLLELEGTGQPQDRSLLEDLAGVAEVLSTGDARELHQTSPGASPTEVRAGEARFGAGKVSLIAGPCAVEDEQALLHIARGVRARGATLLRGGAYKPRTSPYSFQGLGRPALEMLARVRAEVGIGVVTEVLDTRDVEAVAEVADMIQIGARSMASSPLLLEVGRTMKPVLLKRGFHATIKEWLLAAEYILKIGNPNVILCERGIRSFDGEFARNVLDLTAIQIAKKESHLPVIADPSHGTGMREYVIPMGRAAIAAGADGLIIESHPNPAEALSDGPQSIPTAEIPALAEEMTTIAAAVGRTL